MPDVEKIPVRLTALESRYHGQRFTLDPGAKVGDTIYVWPVQADQMVDAGMATYEDVRPYTVVKDNVFITGIAHEGQAGVSRTFMTGEVVELPSHRAAPYVAKKAIEPSGWPRKHPEPEAAASGARSRR